MLKDSTAVIGLGLGGMTVTYEFQERNYLTYSVNGSEQDIKSIPNAKNSMRLEGYDGLAGNRELAYEALKRNKHILKKLKEIEKKIITETLIDMAERQQNYAMNGNFKMPELKVKDASGNSVNNVYNTFTVQGDLTRDTLPELNKILDLASSKTQNDIRKNKRRFG